MPNPSDALYDSLEAALDDDEFFGATGGDSDLEFDLSMLDFEDEDDDDEFGWSAYGQDEGDADDDDLSDLESDIDAELYGQEARARPVIELTAEQMDILDDATGIEVLMPVQWQDRTVTKFLEWLAARAGGDDAAGIVHEMEKDPNFPMWSTLNNVQKEEVVWDAVRRSAAPGLELVAWERLSDAWKNSDGGMASAWDMAKATPGALWSLATDDFWHVTAAWMDEILPIDFTRADIFNQTAMAYWVLEMMGYPLIEKLTQKIDIAVKEAGIIPSMAPSFPIPDEGVDVDYPVGPPTEYAPPASGWLPRPQTILGLGYGTMVVTSLLGIGTS